MLEEEEGYSSVVVPLLLLRLAKPAQREKQLSRTDTVGSDAGMLFTIIAQMKS